MERILFASFIATLIGVTLYLAKVRYFMDPAIFEAQRKDLMTVADIIKGACAEDESLVST